VTKHLPRDLIAPQQALGAIDHDDDDDHRDEHLNQPDEGGNFETKQGKPFLDRSGKLREERDNCRAEDGSRNRSASPDGKHGDDLEDKNQFKDVWVHRSDMVDPQGSPNSYDKTTDDERVNLVSQHVDSQDRGQRLILPDGHKSPAELRALEPPYKEYRQEQDAVDPPDIGVKGYIAYSQGTMRPGPQVDPDVGHDDVNADGRQDEVMAPQPEGWKDKHDAGKNSHDSRRDEGGDERPLGILQPQGKVKECCLVTHGKGQQGCGVGRDEHDAPEAQREDVGVAVGDAHAQTNDRVDAKKDHNPEVKPS